MYSVRPLPGAPVSTQLAWDELTEDVDPREFTLRTVPERVARRGDLAAPILRTAQRLEKAREGAWLY